MEKKQFSPLFEILELNKFIYKKEHCLCYQYNWAFSNVDIKKNSILSERSLGVLILQGTTRWSRFGLSALYRQHQGHLSVGGPTYKFFFFFFELCRVLIVFFFPLSSDEIIQYVTDYCFSTLTRILREKDPFSQAGWFWPCRVPYSIYVGAMYAK